MPLLRVAAFIAARSGCASRGPAALGLPSRRARTHCDRSGPLHLVPDGWFIPVVDWFTCGAALRLVVYDRTRLSQRRSGSRSGAVGRFGLRPVGLDIVHRLRLAVVSEPVDAVSGGLPPFAEHARERLVHGIEFVSLRLDPDATRSLQRPLDPAPPGGQFPWLRAEAGDGARTHDPQLGKLMLYQLSYTRTQGDSTRRKVRPREARGTLVRRPSRAVLAILERRDARPRTRR